MPQPWEVIPRYLPTPSFTNCQRFLALTPAALTACTGQPTTFEDHFRLPLQDPYPHTDAALFMRLAPAAVSAPRHHAFSRSTTSGGSASMFSPSTTTLLSKSEPAKCLCSSRNGARDAASREQHEQQKDFRRCPALRIFLVPHMQPQLGRGSAHRSSCPQRSGTCG
jgi:hypothetical protein